MNNKKERYSRVPRLLDTRYSANGTKGKWGYASSKARLKIASIYGYVGGRQILALCALEWAWQTFFWINR